jgi:hypothetical protein
MTIGSKGAAKENSFLSSTLVQESPDTVLGLIPIVQA